MAQPSDTQRIAKVHTPLGPKLVFREMTGREELSRLFDYRLELLAEDDSGVDPKALLGHGITVELETQGGGKRYIDAQCTRFGYVGLEPTAQRNTNLFRYEARLSPWLWYATLQSNCRIFQQMSVPDIVKEVLARYGPVSLRLTKPHRTWEYCVQYQETDYNFVSRLLEHEGIYYYFKHDNGQHSLVLIDDVTRHDVLPGYAKIPHIPADLVTEPTEEYIDKWQMAQQVEPGKYETNDYDFKKPEVPLKVVKNKPLPFPHGQFEIYDWPGGYVEPDDGDQYANSRIEELQQPYEISTGFSTARGVTPGYLFTLERCQRRDQNRQYLITAVTTFVRDNPYRSGTGSAAEYQFTLVAQPANVPYRPPRVTPKPHTTGPQTAVVVGPPGEEIYCDKYGRVKVLFHWDRREKQGDLGQKPFIEDASCWIRVSHPWAGAGWGGIHIPRIGQEVVVDFVGGDPDYPIITGRVYNENLMPPWGLPAKAVISGFKSDTHKGNGYNELSMDDTAGKELVNIHAQYDMTTTVEHDDTQTIHNNRMITVDGTHTETIQKATTITMNDVFVHTVQKNVTETFAQNQQITVGQNVTETIGGNYTLTVGGTLSIIVGNQILLQCGDSLVSLKKDGSIATVGKDVKISGSSSVKATSSSKVELGVASQTVTCETTKVSLSGAQISSSAVGPNEISGAIVKIN